MPPWWGRREKTAWWRPSSAWTSDLPAEGDRLILRRTVARSGRSRSFANDEPVSVNVLQELATRLVDIHSQHQTLRLSDQRFRMEALDLWAGNCGALQKPAPMPGPPFEGAAALALEEAGPRTGSRSTTSARWERWTRPNW